MHLPNLLGRKHFSQRVRERNNSTDVSKKIGNLQSMRDCRFPCKVVIDTLSFLARHSTLDVRPGPFIKALLEDPQPLLSVF